MESIWHGCFIKCEAEGLTLLALRNLSYVTYNKITQQLELRNPIVVAAFGGWSDAADLASTAIKFLVEHWKSQKIAEIEAEDFFVFTEARPIVSLSDDMQRTIIWPSCQFLAQHVENLERDVTSFTSVETTT